MLGAIRDGHVMVDTLQLEVEYTGERTAVEEEDIPEPTEDDFILAQAAQDGLISPRFQEAS